MQKWTPKQAARFGYLAGRGASIDTVQADPMLGGRSKQSYSHAATSWRLKFSGAAEPKDNAPEDDATLAVPIPPADLPVLEAAAAARGLSVESFTATMIHTIASERLVKAVMDDDHD
jgi:hypothetical protein